MKNYRITVAGTGYVGLSIAVLLSQHHKVTAVDVVPEKVEISIIEKPRSRTSILKNIWQRKSWI